MQTNIAFKYHPTIAKYLFKTEPIRRCVIMSLKLDVIIYKLVRSRYHVRAFNIKKGVVHIDSNYIVHSTYR